MALRLPVPPPRSRDTIKYGASSFLNLNREIPPLSAKTACVLPVPSPFSASCFRCLSLAGIFLPNNVQLLPSSIIISQMSSSSMSKVNLPCLQSLLDRMAVHPHLQPTLAQLSAKYRVDYEGETPHMIMEAAKRMTDRRNEASELAESEGESGKQGIWGNGEHRLFGWVSVWLQHQFQQASTPPQSPHHLHSYPHIGTLQLIFPHKSRSFLLYELRTLLSRVEKRFTKWLPSAQEKLKQIMESEGGEGGRWQTKWKVVSFRLFVESDYELFFLPQQCREQWVNHLSPDIRREEWTADEDMELLDLVEKVGLRWSKISRLMQQRRSEHMVKNRYHAITRRQSKLKRENRRSGRQAEGPTFRAKITKRPPLITPAHEDNNIEKSNCEIRELSASKQAIIEEKIELIGDGGQVVRVDSLIGQAKEANKDLAEFTQPQGGLSEEEDYELQFPFLHCAVDQPWFQQLQERLALESLIQQFSF